VTGEPPSACAERPARRPGWCAHRAGVVHRDVKPGNVFLTSDGEVKVLDFGIAWNAHEATLTTGDLIGTAAYLAPERVLGDQATPAADIYALGVLLYELLAGRRPFQADSDIELAMAHVHAQPPPLGRVAPSAPATLAAACDHAMAKDPAARPPTAAAFARLLRAPVTATMPRAGRPPTRQRRRGVRGLVVAVLLAAALAALPALGDGLSRVGRLVEGSAGGQGPGGDRPTGGRDDSGDDDNGGPGRSGGGDSGGSGGSGGPGVRHGASPTRSRPA
jgi:eukaryotic-like serine/threonine-protein kinase